MLKINETTIPRDWMVAEYLLDGNANDTAGTNNWTATNVTWTWADRGYVEEVGSFNGSSSQVNTSSNITLNSMSVWIKPDVEITTSNAYWLASRWADSFGIRFWSVTGNATNEIVTVVGGWNSNVSYWNQSTVGNITTDWHHLVLVWEWWTTYRLYKNLIDLWTSINWAWWGAGQISLSRFGSFRTNPYFDWKIWLVRMYDKALTSSEINTLYLEGLRKLWPTNIFTSYPKDSLIASYNAEDITLDTSWNGNDWTASNVTTKRVGQQNVGVYDGSNSIIDSWTQIVSWLTNASVFASVSVDSFSNNDQAYVWEYNQSWDRVFVLDTVTSNNFRLIISDSSNSTIVLTTISWDYQIDKFYNVWFTYDNWDVRMYIDGVEVLNNTTSLSWPLDTTTENFVIWARDNDGTEHFDWKIWLVRAYNKALSQAEITTLHHEGLTKLSFPNYSLRNLEVGKILEISKAQSGGSYIDQTGSGNNWTPTNVTDSTKGLNNVMSFSWGTSVANITTTWQSQYNKAIAFSFNPLETNSASNIKFAMANTKSSTNRANLNWSYNHTAWAFANAFYVRNTSWTNFTCKFSNNFTVGKWYRIVAQIKDWNIELYINWQLDNTASFSWVLDIPDKHCIWWDSSSWINCEYSNDNIYNRALSETEIQQDYYSNKII